jgi:hypothetical protein
MLRGRTPGNARWWRGSPRRSRRSRNEGLAEPPASPSISSKWNTPPCSAQRGRGPNPGNAARGRSAVPGHIPRATGAGAEPRQCLAALDDPYGVAGLLDRLRGAGAGRHADSSIAGDRHVRAPPRAERRRGSVPFRTGGRRHPGRAMGLGRPGLMACSPAAGTAGTGTALSRAPCGDRPARQHYPRI